MTMPVDTSIYNAFLAPQKSALEYQNEFLGAQAQRQKIQQNAIGLQGAQASLADAQRVRDEQSGIRSALAGLPSTSTPDDQVKALRSLGTPTALTTADTLATSYGNQLKSAAGAAKDNADAGKTTQATAIEKHNQRLQALATVQSPEDAVQWALEGVKSGDMPSESLPIVLQKIGAAAQAPGGLGQWKQRLAQAGQSVQQQREQAAPKPTEVRLGNVVKIIDMNGYSPTYGKEVVQAQPVGVSPDAQLQANTSADNNRDNIAKDYAIAGLDGKGGAVNGTGLLDEATIANAAARYNTDGTLPPNLGRGQQGPREIASILKEASVQAAARGDTPEAQRVAQLANKASSQALNKLQSQQTMVGAFEKNFNKNADMAEQLSAGVDRTGSPLINGWLNAGKRAVTGDPNLSAFDASLKATVNEYAKIVSGGSGGGATAQGEITKVEGLLNAAQKPEQVKAVLDLMRRETKNRMAAFDDEKSQLTSSMIRPSGKPSSASTASPGVPPDIQAILDRHGKK